MIKILDDNEFVVTGALGGFCPYWTRRAGRVVVADTAEEIISGIPEEDRVIDPVATLSLLNSGWIHGNRTLVQGVYRMPWHSRLSSDGMLHVSPPIPHGAAHVKPEQAARHLRELLSRELLEAARDHHKIYLLLSGGLDSRVVAGVLKAIEREIAGTITCVTWGLPESRDVVYAKRVAVHFGWPLIHVPIDAESTLYNLERGATWGGGELEGVHLHGMNWFQAAEERSIVIAASYGDSIGRAEFSGRHLLKLDFQPIDNAHNLVHPALIRSALATAEEDRATAWQAEPCSDLWVRCELDRQENYMRRMIGHAMDYIRQFSELHQAFTSEAVVTYMWSLCPTVRTNSIYTALLKEVAPGLSSLPWARTGIAPDGSTETDFTLSTEYHRYGKWIRTALRPFIEDHAFSKELASLGLFFRPAMRRVYRQWRQCKAVEAYPELVRTVAQLATIDLTRRHFHLKPCRTPTPLKDAVSPFVWKVRSKLAAFHHE